MSKKNCWEFKKCGREPGGANVERLGVCSVTTETDLDGTNGGKNAGRACWVVISDFYYKDPKECYECDFYKLVMDERKRFYSNSRKDN